MNLTKKLMTSYEIVMSNNKKWLCHTMGGKTVIYDTDSWGKVVELSKPANPNNVHFTIDDKLLYIKNTVGTICVYGTDQFQLIKTIKSNKSLQIIESNFVILDEPFTVLDILKINDKEQICTLNIETGKYKVLTELEGTHIEFHQGIPDEDSYLYTLSSLEGEKGHLVQKLVKVREPLMNPSYTTVESLDLDKWRLVFYEPTHREYIFVHNNYKLTFMDTNLKTILRSENLLDKGLEDINKKEYFNHIHVSNEGKYIVLSSMERVVIFNYNDLKPLAIEDLEYACFAEFSKDDHYLLVGTWNSGYVLENNLN